MATLNKLLIQQLIKKKSDGLTKAQLMAVLNGLAAGKQKALLDAVKTNSPNRVGKVVLEAVQSSIQAEAKAEADAALADGKLTAGELDNIFGGA